ncbi:MAG: hypothetical protein Q9169_003784 [Polycauliona sp. 2 TL-2023]
MHFNLVSNLGLLSALFSLSSALPVDSVESKSSNSVDRRSFSGNNAHGALVRRTAIGDLEQTALGFINVMATKQDGKYKDRGVLLVGGFAMAHYYPDFRETGDCDIHLEAGNPPAKSVKEWVRDNSDKKFEIGLRNSNWKLDNGQSVSIDVIDDAMSEDKPVGYKKPSEISSAGDLPFISKADLLVSKLVACSERQDDSKKEQDAKDAKQIVDADGNPNLSDDQKQLIIKNKECMNDVYDNSDTDAKWWAEKAGLDGLVEDGEEQEEQEEEQEEQEEEEEEEESDDEED